MWDWVSTPGAGLFSNPSFGDAPSLGQFFGCQYFEEWSSLCLVVLRLFSAHNLCLYFNDLRCLAVHKTAFSRSNGYTRRTGGQMARPDRPGFRVNVEVGALDPQEHQRPQMSASVTKCLRARGVRDTAIGAGVFVNASSPIAGSTRW